MHRSSNSKANASAQSTKGNGASKRIEKNRYRKERGREYRAIDYTSESEKAFLDKINKAAFDVSIITGDGNCFFRALSHFLFGNENRHMEVREKIVNFIEANEESLSLFVEDDEPFEEYVSRMRTLGQWGGHIELYSASIVFNTIILVVPVEGPFYIVNANDRGPISTSSGRASADAPKTVRYASLSFHDECHYNVLVPRSDIVSSIRLLNSNSEGGSGAPSSGGSKKPIDVETETCRMVPWIDVKIVKVALKRFKNNVLETIEYLINCHDFDELYEFDVEPDSGDSSAIAMSNTPPSVPNAAADAAEGRPPKWVKKPKTLSKRDQRKMARTTAAATDLAQQSSSSNNYSSSNSGSNGNGKSAEELLGDKVGGIFI